LLCDAARGHESPIASPQHNLRVEGIVSARCFPPARPTPRERGGKNHSRTSDQLPERVAGRVPSDEEAARRHQPYVSGDASPRNCIGRERAEAPTRDRRSLQHSDAEKYGERRRQDECRNRRELRGWRPETDGDRDLDGGEEDGNVPGKGGRHAQLDRSAPRPGEISKLRTSGNSEERADDDTDEQGRQPWYSYRGEQCACSDRASTDPALGPHRRAPLWPVRVAGLPN
jgi:hypothetical protein